MNKSSVVVSALVLLAGSFGGYYYWQANQAMPDDTITDEVVPEESEPEVRLIVDDSPVKTPLPLLEASDSFLMEAMATVLGDESLMKVFINKNIIQKMVVTIDNLPSMTAPGKMMPIEMAAGIFMTSGGENNLVISADNAERYIPYMKVVDAINAKALVQQYVRVYPLFQQAYEELGYPDKYFNDRLLFVINDLLAAPDIEEPVRLVQPLVVYKFADPDLESRNIGQRIIMRIGSKHEENLKSKLREIKMELLNHMDKNKVKSAG
jgi:hypothetical protein